MPEWFELLSLVGLQVSMGKTLIFQTFWGGCLIPKDRKQNRTPIILKYIFFIFVLSEIKGGTIRGMKTIVLRRAKRTISKKQTVGGYL